jgi:hypothetical protein
MNASEKAFLSKSNWMVKSGISFEALAREALAAKFGGSSESILRGLSFEALARPESFLASMSRLFGNGAIAIYDPITKYIDKGLYTAEGYSPVLDLIRRLGVPKRGGQTAPGVFLHDHRVQDEAGNYPDNSS